MYYLFTLEINCFIMDWKGLGEGNPIMEITPPQFMGNK